MPFVQCTAKVVVLCTNNDVQPTRTIRPGAVGAVAGVSQARGLGKRFGDLWALRDLDLDVAPGTVLGLLGHNGAGKTTAIRILTTLSPPTDGLGDGRPGIDVVAQPAARAASASASPPSRPPSTG